MQEQDELQIRHLIEKKAAALRSRDAEGMVESYAPQIVQFSLAPPLRHVGEQARDADGVRQWLAGFQEPIDIEIRDLEITVGAEVAFCHSLHRLTATPVGAPDSFSLWFRVTLGLRRIDGAWTITHEHQSTPFDMDGSFRASVGLEP